MENNHIETKIEISTDLGPLTIKNLDTGEEYVIGQNDIDYSLFDTFNRKYKEDLENLNDKKNGNDEKSRFYESMTIKNLDTGEEFIIGENDPDFDLDTFEIKMDKNENDLNDQKLPIETQMTFWERLLALFLGTSSKSPKNCMTNDSLETDSLINDAQAENMNNFKNPFTKLSSFRFRKELGRGAFGRVLLAEAKIDSKLYALKIISKRNMRSSDKRQAKTERDILHSMANISPHPFTASLKFAFQSENNLYLGMDYICGGNLRELIKRFGCLPEVSIILRLG
jgi:hypothetical protein